MIYFRTRRSLRRGIRSVDVDKVTCDMIGCRGLATGTQYVERGDAIYSVCFDCRDEMVALWGWSPVNRSAIATKSNQVYRLLATESHANQEAETPAPVSGGAALRLVV